MSCRKATSSENRKVVFQKHEKGCFAKIGNAGGQTKLNLDDNSNLCWKQKTIQHEILHAFGLFHMQARPDRDNYIYIDWGNIGGSCKSQWLKQHNSKTYGVEYDGRSFMHYTAEQCAIHKSWPSFYSRVSVYYRIFWYSKLLQKNEFHWNIWILSFQTPLPEPYYQQAESLTKTDILTLKKMYGCSTSKYPNTIFLKCLDFSVSFFLFR